MKKRILNFSLFVLIVLLSFMITSCNCNCKKDSGESDDNQPVNQNDFTDLSVREYTGKNGVVAAASPYAAKAGLEVLAKGGNAFDAAVAVAFAIGVVEPNASGLGGGGLMVAYDATSGNYVGYNFREFYPGNGNASLIPNSALTKDDKNISTTPGNIYAVGVPTEVAGLLKIKENHGSNKISLGEIMAPAIDYAENGFEVTPLLSKQIATYKTFLSTYSDSDFVDEVFTSNGEGFDPLASGEKLVQKDYAKALKKVRDEGLDGFYQGDIANQILEKVGSGNGGFMTQSDLDYAKNNYPISFDPFTGNYHGYKVVTANIPSSGGIVLVEAMNMLDSYFGKTGLKGLGHNSAEYINAVSTALSLSFGDKIKYVADYNHDSSLSDVSSGITSPQYATDRYNAHYSEGHAYYSDTIFGDPTPYMNLDATLSELSINDKLGHYSTTTFSVADKDGNIVTITQTINTFFGSCFVPEGYGFCLNNQCSDLDVDENSVHYVKPYKQPVSSMMPTIVLDANNKPWATIGSPGANRIPAAILQVLLNLIDFDMGMQEAINASRFYTYPNKDHAYVEVEKTDDITDSVIQLLQSFGYEVDIYEKIDEHFGGVQAIKFNSDGSLTGGADPRRDGKALGY